MALITEIRKQFWFILIVLGLALAAFIMMDAQSFGNGGGGRSDLGSVAGTKIDYMDFQNAQSAMYSGSNQDVFTTRNTLWNHFVDKAVLEKEAESLGLRVTEGMIDEMKNGTRLSPVVRGFFPGQNGQFDQNFYNNFKQQLESEQLSKQAISQWSYLDNFIVRDHLQSQISNISAKGVYTPTWMAEMLSKDQKVAADFRAVKIPYGDISDVDLTDADLTNYLNAHKADYFNKEEKRVIEYLEFEVLPTSADTALIFDDLVDIKNNWATASNDSSFVISNDGFYPLAYTKDAGLSAELKNVAYDMEVGDIYGPYLSQGSYNLAKLVDRKAIPDSVEVRHILRGNIKTQEEAVAAHALIDSLKNLLETGQASFSDLAIANSTDGSASKGGDLGTTSPGQMVGPFNDLIFYGAEVGKYYKVGSQFGLHLVEVTKKKYVADKNRDGLRMVYIPMAIVPSDDTQNNVLSMANSVLNEVTNLDQLRDYASANNKLLTTTDGVGANAHIVTGLNPGQNARDIVQWSFLKGTKVGGVSPVVHIFDNEELYYNEKFVVAALKSVSPKGYKSLSEVKEDIRPLAMQYKKSESLKSILAGKSLAEIASQYNTKVDTISGAKFSSPQVAGFGSEPSLMANVLKSDLNKVAGPIAGEGGVYYVYPLSVNKPESVNDVSFIRNTSGLGTKNSAPSQILQSLKDAYDVEDSRSTFF